MTYRGHIRNGQVVLDEPAQAPDGTPVTVTEVTTESIVSPEGSLRDTLLEFAGIITDMPSDFAKNHDHYIHGQPKK